MHFAALPLRMFHDTRNTCRFAPRLAATCFFRRLDADDDVKQLPFVASRLQRLLRKLAAPPPQAGGTPLVCSFVGPATCAVRAHPTEVPPASLCRFATRGGGGFAPRNNCAAWAARKGRPIYFVDRRWTRLPLTRSLSAFLLRLPPASTLGASTAFGLDDLAPRLARLPSSLKLPAHSS